MDKVAKYQEIIYQELENRARRRAANMPDVERQLIVDAHRGQFILLSIGWHGAQYVHQCLLHVQIRAGKIWVHEDLTDPGLLETLLEKGVRPADVVLGYIPEMERTTHEALTA